MDIEFDSVKDAANIRKHRLSLADAGVRLAGPHNVDRDDRADYGEERMIATGEIGGRLHVCVYTLRGPTCRIISLRKANRREIDAYRKSDLG